MSFLSSLWNGIKGFIAGGLDLLHGGLEPVFGVPSWGWAIIALTVVVRVIMIPLAVKQFNSMRAMQELQPQIKTIQGKYKTDRSMMRSDPERYRKIQSKKNEELQALYKEHDVNPVAGCLPLLAQGPIFFALYDVLRNPPTLVEDLSGASFYMFDSLGVNVGHIPEGGLVGYLTPPGLWGLLLILGVAGSMFISQRQMMGRRQPSSQGDVQATQQKVMLYAMPAMMGFFGFQLPVGVLLYWVTTNLWTMAQQAFIMREAAEEAGSTGGASGGDPSSNGDGTGTAGNVRRPAADDSDEDSASDTSKKKGGRKKQSRRPRDDDGTDGDEPDEPDESDTDERDDGADGSRRSSHLPTRPSRRK